MTERQAWATVASELTGCGLPFTALGFLPGTAGAVLDDNVDAVPTPPTGGIRLMMRPGSEFASSSPGGTKAPLVFVVQLDCPGGDGNGRPQDYAEQVKGLFRRRSLTAPGASGALIWSRAATDYIGRPAEGQGLYRVNVNLVFDSYSYQ